MNDKITKLTTNNIFRIILASTLGLLMLTFLFTFGNICAIYLIPSIVGIHRAILQLFVGLFSIPAGLMAGFLSLEKNNSLIVLIIMTSAGAMTYILLLGVWGIITTAFVPLGVFCGYYLSYEWEEK